MRYFQFSEIIANNLKYGYVTYFLLESPHYAWGIPNFSEMDMQRPGYIDKSYITDRFVIFKQ